jgi:spermidine synthase
MTVAIMILMAASGCAALIYEIVWLQLLELIIGSSAVSLGLLLGTYMGGLFLGSIAFAKAVSAKRHPLRVYVLLEAGIGICGVLILWILPAAGRLYATIATPGLSGLVVRGSLCALCLLPPTILMGATFPAVSRWVEMSTKGMSRLGLFYAANIGGAVLGCVLAGFYLLRVYDLSAATYVAVAINLVVALSALALSSRAGYVAASVSTSRPAVAAADAVYVGIAVSGLCALGAQVVWTRILSVMLGATVYTFSIILGVYLVGLGIGSAVGSFIARRFARARAALGVCQLLLAVSIGWAAWMLAKSLPYWSFDPATAVSPWVNFEFDVLRTALTIFPATLLWGASFPLALAALASPGQDPAHLAGEAYGANTAGAIIGAIAFSLVLIPALGTMQAERVLIGLSAIAALVVVGWPGVEIAALSLGLAVALVWSVSDVPWQVTAYGRNVNAMIRSDVEEAKQYPAKVVLYKGEGINSSIAVTEQWSRRVIYVNGNAEASNGADDIRLERMAGHIPAMLHANPHDVLVVGFGAGITAGSFTVYPQVKRIVIAELESLVPAASTEFFNKENYGVFNDPRTVMVYDDGRHYILTTRDKFDVITSDPVHLWVKGTSALYSKEYFELVRARLNPGGVVAQWLPLYDGDLETVKSVLATFFEAFPNATVWSNHHGEQGYDLVLIGRAEPAPINVDGIQEKLDRADYAAVLASLHGVGFNTSIDLLGTYLGRASDLAPFVAGAQINRDRNLRLQYLAGFDMNAVDPERNYQALLRYRRFPEGLFTGSEPYLRALAGKLEIRGQTYKSPN